MPYCGDISRRIDAGLESGGSHQVHRVFAPGYISVGIRNAAYSFGKAPTFTPSVNAQLFQTLLQPLSQWLYEYSMDNFRRQAQINRILFAALQALAIESARLRMELDAAKSGTSSRGSGAA